MSDYAKLSRNRGAPTDSNTGERSKQVPTHPFSGQSGSPSAYSRSRQVESPEEGDLNFEISHQNIMPLISTMKDQNMHLKHERQQIEAEMATLHKLSQMVLIQNQKLRQHYSERTTDIKKLISTISINTSQQTNDIQHQTFLLKESNYAIVKEIQALRKHNSITGEQNHNKKRNLQELSQKNVMSEQSIRDIQVNNRQLAIRCERSQQSERTAERAIEQSVNNLLSEVTALKNNNKKNILQARNVLNQHVSQRPEVEQNLNSIVLKIMELSNQSKQMQEKARAAEQQCSEKRQLYEQSVENVMNCLREHQRRRSKYNDDQQQMVEKRNQLVASLQHIKQQENTLAELSIVKEGLLRSIQAKKGNLRQHEQAHRDKIEKEDSTHRQNLRKIRDTINQQTADAKTQSIARIQPESIVVDTKLNEAKEQFATLVQEVQEIQQNIGKLENPLKAIIRMEYELKRQKAKQ